jgi:hypothetical protein
MTIRISECCAECFHPESAHREPGGGCACGCDHFIDPIRPLADEDLELDPELHALLGMVAYRLSPKHQEPTDE